MMSEDHTFLADEAMAAGFERLAHVPVSRVSERNRSAADAITP